MGFFDKVKAGRATSRKRKAGEKKFFDIVLADEREKARTRATFAQATMLRAKAKKRAEFETLSRPGRAKARLARVGGYLSQTKGVINKITVSLNKAAVRFDQRAEAFNKQNIREQNTRKQNTRVEAKGNTVSQLGGSLGRSIFKK